MPAVPTRTKFSETKLIGKSSEDVSLRTSQKFEGGEPERTVEIYQPEMYEGGEIELEIETNVDHRSLSEKI
jgi:hypothetical protein